MLKNISFQLVIFLYFLGLIVVFSLFITSCQPRNRIEQNNSAKVFNQCLSCHSNKEMQRGPILEGMESWYIESQLIKFKKGIRGSNRKNTYEMMMSSVSNKIGNEKEIKELAIYISSLNRPKLFKSIVGNPNRGKALSQACFTCHGIEGIGNKSLKAPAINHLEDWYLYMQLQNFKSKRRGYHALDTEGQIMANSIKSLNSKDFKDIISYLNTLQK